MVAAGLRWLCVVFVLLLTSETFGNNRFRRFEYKYSFKPPYLAQKDGSVPFWEYGGNAIASSENVRIAPSMKSQKGAIWTKSKTNFDWLEVDIVFRITGRGRLGADGLAFWFTESKGAYDGPVFGSSDKWVGLGVFFDSFDNDNKHNNPFIMGVLNDGTKEFDHPHDGATQMLNGCMRDFRNKPYPTRARIEYYLNSLTVLIHSGMTNNEQEMEICFRADNVVLPKNGYFGLSAATGGLADDHDVLHFLTTSLHPPGQAPPPPSPAWVTDEEQKKLSQEYADYQKKLEQQKEEYRREHPDAVKDRDQFSDEWFESDSQRELRQIFAGQSKMSEMIHELSRKLDEVVGRQERVMSLLSGISTGGQVAGGQPLQITDTIRRHEVDAVLSNQNTIINAAREIRSTLHEVHSRADTILQTQSKQSTGQVASVSYEAVGLGNEVRDALNSLKREMAQKVVPSCPSVSCVSLTMVLVIVAGQMLVLLLYVYYRDNKEAQAKKFF
ncbi:protein ERGIC-53-like [Schistocerca piceifrons]|uniref:protein ERGIC-53-like n=1 Tax=Schistocerca piceifrons TaxID=274613 RepID=UPI001F5EC13E|nr:protein ERGIC-53-like [Schistocerca piceifrons]